MVLRSLRPQARHLPKGKKPTAPDDIVRIEIHPFRMS